MSFDLFFPTSEQHVFGPAQVAYVCLVDSYRRDSSVLPPNGIELITGEATDADACCRHIDGLIRELEALKLKARNVFRG